MHLHANSLSHYAPTAFVRFSLSFQHMSFTFLSDDPRPNTSSSRRAPAVLEPHAPAWRIDRHPTRNSAPFILCIYGWSVWRKCKELFLQRIISRLLPKSFVDKNDGGVVRCLAGAGMLYGARQRLSGCNLLSGCKLLSRYIWPVMRARAVIIWFWAACKHGFEGVHHWF